MISRGKSRYASEFFVASTDLQRAPGGGVVLKHGLVVIGQHLLQGAGHWVAPQQVVVQRTICVKPEKKKSNYQGLQNGISIGVLMNELTSYWGPGSIACQSNHKQDDPAVKIMNSRAIKKKYLGEQTFTYGLSLSFTLRLLSSFGISSFRNKSSLDTPGQTYIDGVQTNLWKTLQSHPFFKMFKFFHLLIHCSTEVANKGELVLLCVALTSRLFTKHAN